MTLSKLTRVLFSSLLNRLFERDGLNRYFASERSSLPANSGKANGNRYPIEVAKPLSHPLSAFPGMLYMQMKLVDNIRMVFFKSCA